MDKKYILPQTLRKVMFERDITVRQLAKIMETKPVQIYRWLNIESIPSGRSLMKLGDIFDVKIDYLLYGEENV